MGVWIETARCAEYLGISQSHPAWVCGLKIYGAIVTESHPAWVCGLKPCNRRMSDSVDIVTPCVGVWIETIFTRGDNSRKW